MKHTKGEWKVLRQIQGNIITGIGVEQEPNYYTVLFNNILPNSDEEYEKEREEQEANAKLIAAAPDLLNTLIEIEEYINKMGVVSIAMRNIKSKVRSSIQKATS